METTNHRGTPDDSARRRPPDRGRRWPAAGALAGALLIATLAADGCSSGPATGGASRGGPADGAVTDPLVLQGDHDLVSFARCMRAHGVQMSDPYHQPGRTSPQFRSADSACRHLLPAGVTDDGTGP